VPVVLPVEVELLELVPVLVPDPVVLELLELLELELLELLE
jgi:hypothetical protein